LTHHTIAVYDASPQSVFSRSLTSSAFPSDVKNPPSLTVSTVQSAITKFGEFSWIAISLSLAMITFLAVLARSWLQRDETLPLGLVAMSEPQAGNEFAMGGVLLVTLMIIVFIAYRLR
jgi:hypothetical protein